MADSNKKFTPAMLPPAKLQGGAKKLMAKISLFSYEPDKKILEKLWKKRG